MKNIYLDSIAIVIIPRIEKEKTEWASKEPRKVKEIVHGRNRSGHA